MDQNVDTWFWQNFNNGANSELGVASGYSETNAISINGVACQAENNGCGMAYGTQMPK